VSAVLPDVGRSCFDRFSEMGEKCFDCFNGHLPERVPKARAPQRARASSCRGDRRQFPLL
jgi:hypothetical protein